MTELITYLSSGASDVKIIVFLAAFLLMLNLFLVIRPER